jgi:hypothetical protein
MLENREILTMLGESTDPNQEPEDGYAIGLWLGYPLCCVANFADRIRAFREGRFEDIPRNQKLDGTGFVPCPECNATKSEDELRREITTARICPAPFPEYDVD